MKNSRWAIAVALMVAVGCAGGEAPSTDDGRLRVVATTTIVGDLVRMVGGDAVDIEVLMGPGIDPHLYKASAGNVRRMSEADVIVYNGLHLEGKMAEVFEEVGERGVTTIAVAECIDEGDLLAHQDYAGLHDPHAWFDVGLWSRTVGCLADELARLDPSNAAVYRVRADEAIDELEALDDWVRGRVDELPPDRRVLVTAHDAFSYFARAYGFEVRGLVGISTAAEAGAADVQELADFIVARGIPAIFVETSVSPRLVEALQEAVAARGVDVAIGGILYSDSLGDADSEAGTYIGTVRSNVETIVTALEKE
jgi:manganese/zinc/iron transport system substrate-binding protein